MEQKDMWQDMRRHLSDMADTIDGALRRIPPFSSFARVECPPVNTYEAGDAVIVIAEVPGVPRENLSVSIKQGALVIQGKEDRSRYEGYSCVCRERGAAEFNRRIALPSAVDLDAEPAASLENGLLTIRLKKKPVEEGKTIRIDVG